MFLDKKKHLNKNGLTAYNYYICETRAKKRDRKYIRKNEIADTLRKLQVEKTMKKKLRLLGRHLFSHGISGPRPKLGGALTRELKNAGYKVYSCNRICRDSGRFFTLETARVRYLHLSPGIQAVIDSPERLLELEKMALSLMKSKVRNRQHSNFMSCFNALVESISGTRCQNS